MDKNLTNTKGVETVTVDAKSYTTPKTNEEIDRIFGLIKATLQIEKAEKDKEAKEKGYTNIFKDSNFYFAKGKEQLDELRKEERKNDLSLLQYFINNSKVVEVTEHNNKVKKKGWYNVLYPEVANSLPNLVEEINSLLDNKISEGDAEKILEIAEKINNFASYCDQNARRKVSPYNKGNNFYQSNNGVNEDNHEQASRFIAKKNMSPDNWITNILKHLQNENDVNPSVVLAIAYFDDPVKRFPILSEDHRTEIAKYFGIEDKGFDTQLKALFDNKLKKELESGLLCNINENNITAIYTTLIYKLSCEWNMDVSFYENNRNVILTGAPGTGKTYTARKIAAEMIGCSVDKLNDNEQFCFVQFHPSYDYSDFVEGLRPTLKGGFEHKDGKFKAFCKDALDVYNENKARKCVIIIDEINRGEISKIFGELFFSIDPGYREEKNRVKVQTQYQNLISKQDKFSTGFYVPENVYIIGTMNDIDRSVESMDFAFRRRFAFLEIEAKDDMLITMNLSPKDNNTEFVPASYKAITKLREAMNTLNAKIISEDIGLTKAYQLGGSYFLKIANYYKEKNQKYSESKFKDALKSLWNYHLKGTLFEYFRGEPDAEKKMEILKQAYFSTKN